MRIRKWMRPVIVGLSGLACCAGVAPAVLQAAPPSGTSSGLVTDPETGLVYRPVHRTVETPVTEVQNREKTVYRPQTVVEHREQVRTVYTPVMEYQWEPRWHNTWNPFSQPTLAYHFVPRARWEARSEAYQAPHMSTQWVAEKQTVPERLVRLERQTEVHYEVVGRIATPAQSEDSAIARLRPLQPTEQVANIAPVGGSTTVTQIGGVAALTSDPPRSALQTGLPTTVLGGGSYSSSGVARLPTTTVWR